MAQLSRLALSLLAVFMAACATAPPTEPMHFDADMNSYRADTDSVPGAPSVGNPCNVRVLRIKDQRRTTSLGTLPEMQLYGETVPHWVRDSLGTLVSGEYGLSFAQETVDIKSSDLVVEVIIHKVYIHHADVAKNANVVLSVSYSMKGHLQETRFYRGQDTSVNWISSAAEIEGAMNRAMSQVLNSIGKDIGLFC